MNNKVKLVGLTLGDPFSKTSRSGVNYNVFSRFSERCELINVFDLDLKGLNKIILALTNFSVDRRRWGNKIHQNPRAFNIRTQMAQEKINNISSQIDLVYQDGAMFMPGFNTKIPFITYIDNNVILSSKGGKYAHGMHYKGKRLNTTIEQEKNVYDKAAMIFTMSDWLKRSLIKDFDISENKIKTVYAGTNIRLNKFQKYYDGKTIVFIGKNFERKGGKVLLEAFKYVKKEIPESRLIVIGSNIRIDQDGVQVKGIINDKDKITSYLSQASVFALPSFFEPFGIVFAEAFALKTPCIGTNICAMPEIIEDGKGGFLVEPSDSRNLADKLIMILSDVKLAEEMGNYGYQKAQNIFNWDVVVDKILSYSSDII